MKLKFEQSGKQREISCDFRTSSCNKHSNENTTSVKSIRRFFFNQIKVDDSISS